MIPVLLAREAIAAARTIGQIEQVLADVEGMEGLEDEIAEADMRLDTLLEKKVALERANCVYECRQALEDSNGTEGLDAERDDVKKRLEEMESAAKALESAGSIEELQVAIDGSQGMHGIDAAMQQALNKMHKMQETAVRKEHSNGAKGCAQRAGFPEMIERHGARAIGDALTTAHSVAEIEAALKNAEGVAEVRLEANEARERLQQLSGKKRALEAAVTMEECMQAVTAGEGAAGLESLIGTVQVKVAVMEQVRRALQQASTIPEIERACGEAGAMTSSMGKRESAWIKELAKDVEDTLDRKKKLMKLQAVLKDAKSYDAINRARDGMEWFLGFGRELAKAHHRVQEQEEKAKSNMERQAMLNRVQEACSTLNTARTIVELSEAIENGTRLEAIAASMNNDSVMKESIRNAKERLQSLEMKKAALQHASTVDECKQALDDARGKAGLEEELANAQAKLAELETAKRALQTASNIEEIQVALENALSVTLKMPNSPRSADNPQKGGLEDAMTEAKARLKKLLDLREALKSAKCAEDIDKLIAAKGSFLGSGVEVAKAWARAKASTLREVSGAEAGSPPQAPGGAARGASGASKSSQNQMPMPVKPFQKNLASLKYDLNTAQSIPAIKEALLNAELASHSFPVEIPEARKRLHSLCKDLLAKAVTVEDCEKVLHDVGTTPGLDKEKVGAQARLHQLRNKQPTQVAIPFWDCCHRIACVGNDSEPFQVHHDLGLGWCSR